MTDTTGGFEQAFPEVPGVLSTTAYEPPDDLSDEDWLSIGHSLRAASDTVAWWVGDWLNYGEDRSYIERGRYDEAVDATGYSRKTLRNLSYVARSVPSSRRRDDLTPSHHAEVTALPAKDQRRWLKRASDDGLSSKQLRAAIVEQRPPAPTHPDAPPPQPKKIYVRPGDLYALGAHRVLCGDAEDSRNYHFLLGDELADIVWTDPPYGRGYRSGDWDPIVNDNLNPAEFRNFLGNTLGWTFHYAAADAAAYICCSWHMVSEFMAALTQDLKVTVDDCIVWNKRWFGPGAAHHRPQHEFILYHAGEQWFGGRDTADLWTVDREQTPYIHPTQKPVQLIEDAIGHSSIVGGIVLDPFLGSGSTLIAAERTGRRCFGIELKPEYVQGAIQRWEDHTGQKAEKLGSQEQIPVPEDHSWWEAMGYVRHGIGYSMAFLTPDAGEGPEGSADDEPG